MSCWQIGVWGSVHFCDAAVGHIVLCCVRHSVLYCTLCETLMRRSMLCCKVSKAVMRHSVYFLWGITANDRHYICHLPVFRFGEAWQTCQILNRKEAWEQLAESLLRNLEIEFGKGQVKLIGSTLQDAQLVARLYPCVLGTGLNSTGMLSYCGMILPVLQTHNTGWFSKLLTGTCAVFVTGNRLLKWEKDVLQSGRMTDVSLFFIFSFSLSLSLFFFPFSLSVSFFLFFFPFSPPLCIFFSFFLSLSSLFFFFLFPFCVSVSFFIFLLPRGQADGAWWRSLTAIQHQG